MYKCGWNGCEKAYGTLNHLNAHVTMQSHGQKRTPEGNYSRDFCQARTYMTDLCFQSSRKFARSGSRGRRKKRPTARLKRSASARLLLLPRLRMEAAILKDQMALLLPPTLAHGLFSCPPSDTSLLSTHHLLPEFLNSSFRITTTAICTPITHLIHHMPSPTRVFLTKVCRKGRGWLS